MEKVVRSRKDYNPDQYDIKVPLSNKGTELSNVLYFVSRNEFVLTLLLVMNTILRVVLYLMLISLFIKVDMNTLEVTTRVDLNNLTSSLITTMCSSGVIFVIGIVASVLISRVLKEARGAFSQRHKQLLKVSEASSWIRNSDSKYILSVDWNSFKQSQGTYFVSVRIANEEQESKVVITRCRDFDIAYKFDMECDKPVLDLTKGILAYNIVPNPNSAMGATLGNWSKLEKAKRCRFKLINIPKEEAPKEETSKEETSKDKENQ